MRRIATLGTLCLLCAATACGTATAPGNNGPVKVTISQPSNGDTFAPGQTITFKGSATDTRNNTAIPNADLVWTSSISGNIGRGATVRTALAAKGNHVITLTATAADGTKGATSVTIKVAVPPLTVTIRQPQDRAIFQSGATITFRANVTKGGTAVPNANIRWTSDGGQIGIGASIQTALPDGKHNIVCTATDSAGDTGSDSITVTVGDPAIRIDHPADKAQLTFGDTIQFSSTVLSKDPAPYAVIWKSDGSQIGVGQNIQTALATAGQHKITASFTNSKGTTVTDSITISYTKPVQPPTVTITKPATDGTKFADGAKIDFAGTAIDPQDGNITASGTWSDPVDGNLGTGGSTSISSAQPGKYSVTFQATDSAGATGQATRIVYVKPSGGGSLTQTQLAGQSINGVSGDGAGGLWVATGSQYIHLGATTTRLGPGDVLINGGTPTSVAAGTGKVAFGADGGISVCTTPVTPQTCTSYTQALRTALDTRHVNKVAVLADGTVVVATDSGFFVISPTGATNGYNGNNWNGSDRVNDLAVGSNGTVYLATGHGLVSYDPGSQSFTTYPTDGLPSRNLTAVAARNGQVWVATDRGVSHLTGGPGSWNWTNYGRDQGLTNTTVTCLALDSNGVVWGGTDGGGAFRLDPQVGTFLMITQADGLPSNHVMSVYIDGQDVKYFGTTNGLGIWYGM